MKIKDRNYGIDVIKIIAVILVLTIHFFLNTEYYSFTAGGGLGIKIQSIIRNFCMICVPLFMLTTGFLNKKTEYNKSFFKGLFNILLVWFFYSLIEYFVMNSISGDFSNFNFIKLLHSITSFDACYYSWYIEMYIGLYLISPILNNAYNSFDKKNRFRSVLIIVLSIMLPIFINTIFNNIIHLPNWWYSTYPIAYYMCGKYISDVNPKIRKKNLILLLILGQIFTLSYNYIAGIEYYTLPIFINTVLVFLIFYDINIKSDKLKKVTTYVSSISLDIYLGSSLIDQLLYPIFNAKLESMGVTQQYSILYAPIILIVVFVASLLYGSIRKLIINVR